MKVRAKTRRGKNRIAQHGDEWRIIEENVKWVHFSDKEGWTLLESVKTGALAWMNNWNDKDWCEADD